jgi:excisionase family DNA binding protein
MPIDTTWLSLEEAAAKIRVSERTIRRYIAAGRLPASTLGGKRLIRIRAEDLAALFVPVEPGGSF